MAWLNLTMPKQTVRNSLKTEKIKSHQMNFALEKQLIKFSCTYYPFSFCKIFLKKNLRVDLELWRRAPFSGPQQLICPEQKFFGTNHCYYFHLPIGPFHCEKFKKNSNNRSRVMTIHHFWAQSAPFSPNNFFFGKLLPSFSSTY